MINSFLHTTAKSLLLLGIALLFGAATSLAQDFKYLEVVVFDEEGKPMADVTVDIKMPGFGFPMPTNDEGKISLNIPADSNSVTLNVRKQGYETKRVRWRRGREVPRLYTVNMEPGKPFEGVVLDSGGNPVEGAEVFIATKEKPLTFLNGKNPANSKQVPVLSDGEGLFTLPYIESRTTIVCLSDTGWAEIVKSNQHDKQPLEIRLAQWAKVELAVNTKEATPVNLDYVDALSKAEKQVAWEYDGEASSEASMKWDRVMPGSLMASHEVPFKLVKGFPMVANRSHGVIVTLGQGEHKKMQLGGAGRKVTGKLILPAGYEGEIDWATGCVALTENSLVDLAMRTAFFEYGKLLSQSNVLDPRDRVPPSSQPNYLVRYLATVKPDGTFAIDGVPPGQYEFTVVLTGKSPEKRGETDLLSVDSLPCRIDAADGESDKPFALGKYVLGYTNSFVSPQD